MEDRTAFCKRGTNVSGESEQPGKTLVPRASTARRKSSNAAQPSLQCLLALLGVGAIVPPVSGIETLATRPFVLDPMVA